MARLPRLNIPNIPQHVIQRGNNRQDCFFSDECYAVYLDKLKEFSRKYQVAVHSFILMTNHVHLLLTPTKEASISRMIQALSGYYVRYINKIYERTGTLWEGRYKSTLVDTENYFLTVSRYIELNPVRAGMVKHPAEYPWSSYRNNALGIETKLISPHQCYTNLGQTGQARCEVYRELFEQQISDRNMAEIRYSINKSWALGSPGFKSQIQQQTSRRVSPLPRGGDKKSESYKINCSDPIDF